MRYPWANTALLAVLLLQLATGFFGLISGSPGFRWVLWLHAAGGYALLVLAFWKGRIILDVLRRRRRRTLTPQRLAFLLMAFMTVVIIVTGGAWTWIGPIYYAGFSLMTIHAVLALILVGFLAWHILARRFVFRVSAARDRRVFLRLAGFGAVSALLWQAGRQARALLELPSSLRRFTGSYETGSFSGVFPSVSWLFDNPASLAAAEWQLIVDGAVEQPLTLSYAGLARLDLRNVIATIDCTGGWYSTQEWAGHSLGALLALCRPGPQARSVTVESITGYSRRFPLAAAQGFLLATHVAGRSLDHGHGAPLRLVAPGYRGFDWVKWVTRIHVNETGHLLQPPLPLQ